MCFFFHVNEQNSVGDLSFFYSVVAEPIRPFVKNTFCREDNVAFTTRLSQVY